MFTSVGPSLASLRSGFAGLTLTSPSQQQQKEEEEVNAIAKDLEYVESTWKRIKAVLADAAKRQIREESVRQWLLELRGLAQKIEDLRDVYEYEVVAKQVEAPEAPPSSDTPQGEILNSYVSKLHESVHPKEVDGPNYNVNDGAGKRKPAAQIQAYQASSSSGDAITFKRRKVGSSMVTSLSPLLDASFRQQIARDLAKIKQDFDDIARRKEALHLKEADGRMYSPDNDGSVVSVPTGRLVTDPVFLGREEQLRQLCALLKADRGDALLNFEVIAVVGMGGMGKTTLAQHACEDPEVVQNFDENMIKWVHVSQKSDVTRLMKAVVEAFSGDYHLNELSPLQDEVTRLVKDKKVYLVADDVWSTESWESFVAPFHAAKRGSKILVTTRLREVAHATKAVKTIDLSSLSEKDGWSLLKQHAFLNQGGDVSPMGELEEIGKKITAKCHGLPLSLKLLGGLLSYKKDEEGVWKSVLESDLLDLGDLVDPSEGGDAGQKILGSLYLSYLHLSPKLQSCFKFYSRFPNGRIKSKHLKQSWVAYDIVKDKREATGCFDALVSRSFLEMDRSEYGDAVHMHDHIYDLAQYAQEEKIVSLHYGWEHPNEPNEDHFSGAQHVFMSISDYRDFSFNIALANVCTFKLIFWEPMRLHLSSGQYLRELMIRKRIDPFAHSTTLQGHVGRQDRLKYLRIAKIDWGFLPVWVLQSYNLRYLKMRILELECIPDSICNLRNLRGLSLRSPRLRYLPEAMSRLTNLLELNLTATPIRCLPESISKLVNLQELSLNACTSLEELPEGIVNLTNLQFLDLCGTYISPMPKGIGSLTKLTGLSRYVIGSEKGRLAEIKNMRHLERASIFNLHEVVNGEDASNAEMATKSHLRELQLFWYELKVRVYDEETDYDRFEINLGHKWEPDLLCSKLWVVKPQVERRNENEIACRDELTLERLRPHKNMERVCICGYMGYRLPSWMGNGSFSKLHQLILVDINCCTSLSPIHRLPSLEELLLGHMSTLQELVPGLLQSATEPQQPFPKLRKLYIYHCDSIELLPLREFSSLENVKVHRCSNLKHMMPTYHIPCPLEKIVIEGCHEFDFSPDPQSPTPPWKLHIDEYAHCREDAHYFSSDPLEDYENMTDETMTDEDDSSGDSAAD